MTMNGDHGTGPLRIGELARRTGLSVRTLRHYDQLGLLVPRERTFAGHRLYSPAEVRRLYRIVALRELGLALREIRELLDREDADPVAAVREHLAELERRIRLEQDLRARLERIARALEAMDEPSAGDYIDAIERMTMIERHYTPEQLDYLARRREQLGERAIRDVEEEWPRLFARMRAEMQRGSDVAEPRVQELAARMRELVAMFHGGDEGVERALHRTWEQTPREQMIARLEAQGVEDAESRIPEPELAAYIERAHAARADRA